MTKYQIVYRGTISHAFGGGIACGEYILALDRLGVDVKIDNGYYYNFSKLERQKALRLSFLLNKPYAADKPKILVYDSPPQGIDTKKERERFDYLILNTVWETTKIPSQWFPIINEFDAVCVPSLHNIAALKNSGVKIPAS
ncbi:hypothetical protein [Paenibacillus thermotolerans]|uniref:hypothetical protein n=1 Tax=Paenibacillus thermotolerans TaxID=3027807 RepID=UPI002368BCBA|nr:MULTISPECIES: hypothetical protein [unclassified Paenibacillus]